MREFQKNIFRSRVEDGVEVNLCYDLSNPNIACVNCGDIVFDPFDHMVVRFGYNKPGNGSDLDIKVYYDNTGTIEDNKSVGYSYFLKTPDNGVSDSDAYLWWATDDVSSPAGPCVEAVVIGIKNFTTNVTTAGNIIEIPLRVGWYGARGDGNIAVELVTYSGGTMYKSGTNILNSGGTVVDVQSTAYNVTSCCSLVTDPHSNLVGTVQYNKTTKAAVLVT